MSVCCVLFRRSVGEDVVKVLGRRVTLLGLVGVGEKEAAGRRCLHGAADCVCNVGTDVSGLSVSNKRGGKAFVEKERQKVSVNEEGKSLEEIEELG